MKSFYYSVILIISLLFIGCAEAGKGQVVISSTKVTLDGSLSSTEVNGKIKKYRWEQLKGKKVKLLNKHNIKASFIAPNVAKDTKLVFRLTTIEKGGYISPFKSSDKIKILVKPQSSNNTPPTAIIKTISSQIKVNEIINLDASSSFDTEGEIVSYTWIDDNGEILSSEKNFDYKFQSAGKYTITLTVTDEQGLSNSSSVEITVNDLINPIAKIEVSANKIKINESVNFSAASSSDSDGEIISYIWKDSNSNILSSEKNFTYTFDTQGEYQITLTVEDNDGLTHTETVTISVHVLLTSIELTPSELTLEKGETSSISATGNYNDGSSLDINSNVSWTISDKNIISIDNKGTITALKVGTVTIKAVIEKIESNSITVEVKEPLILKSIKVSPNPIILRVNKETEVSIKGIYNDGSIKDIEQNVGYEITNNLKASFDGIKTLKGLETGETTFKVTLGDISSSLIPIKINNEIVTTNFDFTNFGTQYIDQIPENATIEKYDEKLFAMLTGKILDEDENPLPNVKVSIHKYKRYGSVLTDEKGSYVIPAEGGKYLTLRYEKEGYTTIDRKVYTQAEDWSIAEDVTMLKKDDKVTTINLNNSTPQIHSSTIITDDRGSRATTLVFDGITQATVKSPDGNTRILDSIDVRATEFKTPKSMPSDLPVETAYTYCSDLTVDGVKDDETVEFNAPVIMYVNNFLGFEVGEIVPIGYYDRNDGVWKGSKNGTVVKLLDTNNDGKIDSLDATGDGVADDIDGDGTTTSEVKGLTKNPEYQVGMTFWRAEITHFTPWDHNWPYILDKKVKDNDSVDIDVDNKKKKDPCATQIVDSYIDIKKRVFHDDIKISGTNLTLHYSSNRVKGFIDSINISGMNSPYPTAKSARLKLSVGGRTFEKEIDINDFKNKITFGWDGKDKLGKYLRGKVNIKAEYIIEYEAFYAEARTDFEQAWARSGINATPIRSRENIGLKSTTQEPLYIQASPSRDKIFANGWSLSNHNVIYQNIIQKGDGTSISQEKLSNRIIDSLFDYQTYDWLNHNVVLGNNKNIYLSGYDISDGNVSKIIKIDPLQNIETLVGGGEKEITDGVLANEVKLDGGTTVAINHENEVFFFYSNQIIKIKKDGTISIVAGTGEEGYFGDGILATQARIGDIRSIKFDIYGNMYFIDDSRIRKIDKNGLIFTIAGTDKNESSGDGFLATQASIYYVNDIAIDRIGNIYLSERRKNKIRKINTLGIITTIAGTGVSGFSGDGGLAKNAQLSSPSKLATDLNLNLYIYDGRNERIRKVDNKGIISTIVGGGKNYQYQKGQDALDIDIYSVSSLSFNSDNLLNVFRYGNSLIKIKQQPYFSKYLSDDNLIFKNIDNTADIYNKYTGLQVKTIDLATGNSLKEFKYDSNNNLIGIIDQFRNEITISRDSNGSLTFITAPNGQKTYLTVNSNGDLINVSYEDNSQYNLEYLEGSLLTKVTHPNNFNSIVIYDESGKVLKEIDRNSYGWNFNKTIAEEYIDYLMTKPEGDVFSYKDYNLKNGYHKSENETPCGDIVTTITSGDEKEVETITNGVNELSKYKINIKTNQKELIASTITQPSGLKKTNTYNKKYVDNDEGLPLSKTQTINSNGKSILIKDDYENAINTITSAEGRVVKEEYDKNTRLTSKISSGTLTPTTYSYDSKGRIISQTRGERTTRYTYNTRGNIATFTNPRGKTSSYEYDILDRIIKITHANGAIENYSYDASGNITRLVTPINTNHNFTYDGINQRKSMKSPLDKLTNYSYNGNRKLTKIERPSGKTVVNNYIDDKLASTITPEATISYEYIFNNKIKNITKDTEKVIFNYDGDLLTSLAYKGELNQNLTYTYNNDFLPTSFTYAGDTESYTYDKDNLLLSSGDYTLTRDSDNAYVTQTTDGDLVQDYTYDNYGELTKVSNNSFTYEITAKNNSSLITQKEETINNATSTYDYIYDDNARLIKVQKDNTIVEVYTYDNNGNRLSATVNGVTTSASYTLDDQIEVYGDNTYKYDEDGYLKEKNTPNGVTTYAYSTLGELKEVKTPTQTISYKHNVYNQRVAKLINGIVVEKYLWADLTTLLAVYDKDDNLVQRFEYANDRMPISMISNGSKYYLHYDQVGSLRAISNSNHKVIKEITYDSFGNILKDTNSSFYVPFGFAGGLLDKDTGLIRFGYRDYDSFTGKWTAKDPIDFDGGDSNLYGYVLNDPVNLVDIDGLCPILIIPATELAMISAAALAAGVSVSELYNIIKNSMKKGESFNDAYNNYINAKGGKQNIKDTELAGYSKEQLDSMYRDPNTSKKMKQRIKRHQKAERDRHSSQKK